MKTSYDEAFALSKKINKFKNKFSSDTDNIIAYPSAWFTGYYEITIRDKQRMSEAEHGLDLEELYKVISTFIPSGWVLVEVNNVRIKNRIYGGELDFKALLSETSGLRLPVRFEFLMVE